MDVIPLIPPIVALVLILWTKNAALSLGSAVLTGILIIHSGSPLPALQGLLKDILIPVFQSLWNISAIVFTLTLGSFATILEKGGGFTAILHRLLKKETSDPKKRLLFGIYGLGLLCFFDGLANAILLGRISRPLTDALRISRQFLAYLIDSTSSCVACVAFISTWIATQLSLIREGLKDSAITTSPAELFFASIPANPYCLLTLLLIPLVIARSWHPGPMKKAQPVENATPLDTPVTSSAKSALIPLAVLVLALSGFIYLWQSGPERSWQNAFSSPGVPYAMMTAGFVALLAACLSFPKADRKNLPDHIFKGAASLAPALLILLCAWSLGKVFNQLGTANLLAGLLQQSLTLAYFPLAVFLLGALMSFLTGSSWGTMGLLMPMVLPIALQLGADATTIPLVIGAVFGGAVFGDHCSPFSDTTIVSAMASGCTPTSHVITQLPYALITALGASLAYLLMALGLTPALATLALAISLGAFVLTRR
ncbi:MAG: Na+/H+ antiporter NhaC family protein [Verrucomicrobiaceae bacterium]